MEVLFLFCIFILFYIYIGYPLLIGLLALNKKQVASEFADVEKPKVSVVIAAYNEESCIEKTVLNKLDQDYPANKIEVIVVSDGSSDNTDRIVSEIEDERVRFFRQEGRGGKTVAVNRAVSEATGSIIVFSDANSIYKVGAIDALVKRFADSDVGYVTGKMIYVNPDQSIVGDGCSAYMRYENWIRQYESLLGSIVGVDGGIDAVRADLYQPMRADQLPDFVQPLKIIDQGSQVKYEPEALLMEEVLTESADEYRMRVRVALRALWCLLDMRHLFNPFRFGFFSVQLVSHKLLRYLAFIPLVLAFATNIFLVFSSPLFFLTMCGQVACYGLAFAAWRGMPLPKILELPYYFCLLNLAAADATIRFLKKEKMVVWQPRLGS